MLDPGPDGETSRRSRWTRHLDVSRWQRLWSYSQPFRRRFGLIDGVRLAKAMADVEWRASTASVAVHVPSWTDPVWLRPGTSDSEVFRQLVLDDELGFDLPLVPRRILDGGANIGLATRRFHHRWPAAEILAVELDSANASMLQLNCGSLPQVSIVVGALWDGSGTVGVDRSGDAFAYRVSADYSPVDAVRAWTIDELLGDHGWEAVDFVKLDVEGAEARILNGPIEWLSRTTVVAIELHDRIVPGCLEAFNAAFPRSRWDVTNRGEYFIAKQSL